MPSFPPMCARLVTLPSCCGEQALQQVARRTLVTSTRRQVENKVPKKQKLFQVKKISEISKMNKAGINHRVVVTSLGVLRILLYFLRQ